MHQHDGDKQSSWMMWAMMICCAVPLLLIFVFGAGGAASGFSPWVIAGGMAVMIATHFFMMRKSHTQADGKHAMTGEEDKNKNKNPKDDQPHAGHGGCH